MAASLLILSGSASAQTPGVEFSGFVDVYYSYNFNEPATGLAQLRNFDVNHNAFSLNLAELAVEKKPAADSRGGFRIDFIYGHAAAMANAFEPGKNTALLEHIEQAYLSYLTPGAGIQVDFGKFVTPAGFEVVETKDNWNYSRSLLFALPIPYYHMGVRATIPVGERVGFAAYLVNGWNNVFENNTGKTFVGQVSLKPSSRATIVANYIGGPELPGTNEDWRHVVDVNVSGTATSRLSVAADYVYGTESSGPSKASWQGVAGYLKYQASDWFALAPRFEWYEDPDGWSTLTPQTLKGLTLTAEVKSTSGVVMRMEYRRDISDTGFFLKEASDLIENQDTFTVGFLYAFSTQGP